ncbi:MAG: ribonuclease HII [Ruminococcaceae bacterium]|nr:ribonuclease HII [Oscillospiraceae bacterium]
MARAKKEELSSVDWLLYERTAREEGYTLVCGVDEAGRGPLAGPVFAAAVILPPDTIIEGVNDSKKLSEKKREALFDVIREKALAYGIAAADHSEIDDINILNATYLAMRRAVEMLEPAPDLIIVDGNRLPPDLPAEGRTLVKGDALCHSIACASILAKVSRDRFMLAMAEKYPQYQFEKHKGYGTAAHIAALREHGVCPIHRRSFLRKIEGIPQ